ncbi:hypothetical protein ACJ41O_009592 [Fusarium nematophilum]
MTQLKLIAGLIAGLAFSGAHAGPCKPSSTLTSETLIIISESTSSLGTSTATSDITETSTWASSTDVSASDSTTVELPTTTTSGLSTTTAAGDGATTTTTTATTTLSPEPTRGPVGPPCSPLQPFPQNNICAKGVKSATGLSASLAQEWPRTVEQCMEMCLEYEDCGLFSMSWVTCTLYKKPGSNVVFEDPEPGSLVPYYFYEPDCFQCTPVDNARSSMAPI